MPTFKNDLAQLIWKEHFDGLNADYGPKFCRKIIDTVMTFNLSHTSWEGILTIGDVLKMYENGELGVCENCEED